MKKVWKYIVGIGAAVGVLLLALLGLGEWYDRRKRKKKRDHLRLLVTKAEELSDDGRARAQAELDEEVEELREEVPDAAPSLSEYIASRTKRERDN